MFEQAKATNASECLKSMANVVLDAGIDEPVLLFSIKLIIYLNQNEM